MWDIERDRFVVWEAIRNVHALLGTLIHKNGLCGIISVSP
jgi:hypothetical protein